MSELNKLREEVQRRKKENEVERKQFEEKMVEMEKIVEGLKSRIKKLESTLRQNEVEYRNDLQKNQVNARPLNSTCKSLFRITGNSATSGSER